VAELLGIPRWTVHELARRGDLPARRVGRRWIFVRERLAAAITPLDDPAAWKPRNGPRATKSLAFQMRQSAAAKEEGLGQCVARPSPDDAGRRAWTPLKRERRDSNPRPPA
jgi:excisionase family DNA binding protein